MAVFAVTHHQRLDDYAVVQTLEDTDIGIGQSITLAGLGHGLNGAHTVYAINPYSFQGVDDEGDLIFDYDIYIGNQVIFYDAGDDLERSAAIPSGTLTWSQTCTMDRGSRRPRMARHKCRDRKRHSVRWLMHGCS
jgi:hypothetical protein